MRVVLGFLIVTGCHAGVPATRPLPTRTPYLMLFEVGRAWPLQSTDGTAVTCTVTSVKQVGDASVSHLDCGDLLASGTWVAAPAGLYHPYIPVDDPDELALLGADDLLLAATPRDREHEHVLEGGARASVESFGHEGSWCVREQTASPTESRAYTLCFDGTNITGVADDVSTEQGAQHLRYGRTPPESTELESDG